MKKNDSFLKGPWPILVGVPTVFILIMLAEEGSVVARYLVVAIIILFFLFVFIGFPIAVYRAGKQIKIEKFLTKCEEQGIHKLTTEKEIQKARITHGSKRKNNCTARVLDG